MTILRAEGLSFKVGARELLSGVDLSVDSGKSYAVIGPNGAGKSTLLKILGGLLNPHSGEVSLGGASARDLSVRARSQWVSYIPQSLPIAFPVTVLDSVLLGRIAQANLWGEIRRTDLDEARALLSDWGMDVFSGRDIRSLSEGEKQKVSLIRGVFQGSRILLLDETFSSLDVDQQLEAISRLRRLLGCGRALVLVTHDINFATEAAEEFLVLREGRIMASGDSGIFSDLNLIRGLYPRARIEKVDAFSGRSKFIFQREERGF